MIQRGRSVEHNKTSRLSIHFILISVLLMTSKGVFSIIQNKKRKKRYNCTPKPIAQLSPAATAAVHTIRFWKTTLSPSRIPSNNSLACLPKATKEKKKKKCVLTGHWQRLEAFCFPFARFALF
jgi:hypothetical protein